MIMTNYYQVPNFIYADDFKSDAKIILFYI